MLTDIQLGIVYEFIDQQLQACEGHGLDVEICGGLEELASHLRSAGTAPPPWLEPCRVALDWHNSFSVFLKHSGAIVGCMGERVVETEDFYYEIKTHRLFSTVPKIRAFVPRLTEDVNVPTISGRVGLGGGAWVSPEWRGRKLSSIIPRLARVLAVRDRDTDWQVGFVAKGMNVGHLIRNVYGFPNYADFIDDIHPGYDRPHEGLIVWASREEILDQTANEIMGNYEATAEYA